MRLENQFINVQLAMRLAEHKDLKSFFVWEYFSDNCYTLKFIPYAVVPGGFGEPVRLYHAYSVAELGAMLPKTISVITPHPEVYNKNTLKFELYYDENGYPGYGYGDDLTDIAPSYDEGTTEADARAQMILYLVELKRGDKVQFVWP